MHGVRSTVQMDTDTVQNAPRPWRIVLTEQGRTITWLALQTGRPRRSIYAYAQGQMRPTAEWLAAASRALGVEVTA
jgi:predicted transcriptional regulator